MENLKRAEGINKYLGLMFRTRKTQPLEFIFDKPTNVSIHSFFVFFSFKAQWYNEEGILIEERIIKPFTLSARPVIDFKRLVEIPL